MNTGPSTKAAGNDFGRAVSRILSASLAGRREPFVWAAYTRNRFRLRETWSGQLRGPLFGLAPDGVFRASALALGAVGSYPTFSPLPCLLRNPGGLSFCGTVRRQASRPGRLRVSPTSRGYAASRPAVFGLSSPGSRRERSSTLPKSR